MDATFTFKLNLRDAVPTRGRAAWLETYGVPPEGEVPVTVTLPLARWEELGQTLTSSGEVRCSSSFTSYLRGHAEEIFANTGTPPATITDAEIRKLAQARAEKIHVEATDNSYECNRWCWTEFERRPDVVAYRQAKREKEEAEAAQHAAYLAMPVDELICRCVLRGKWEPKFTLPERESELMAECDKRNEAERVAAWAERDAWIKTHGSERLKLAVDTGMVNTLTSEYLRERLAYEMPAWQLESLWLRAYDRRAKVIYNDVHAPTLGELQALADWRTSMPDVEMQFVTIYRARECDDDQDKIDEDDDFVYAQGRVLTDTWRGHTIVRPLGWQ